MFLKTKKEDYMVIYYSLYWIIYFLIVWVWYILSGSTVDIEINIVSTIIVFSIPSFLPEMIVRIIGKTCTNKNKEFKKVCEEMRVYAIIGNTLLIGLIANSYLSNPSFLGFLGFSFFGFLVNYLPVLGIWLLGEYIFSVFIDNRSIYAFFKNTKELLKFFKMIRSYGDCQGYPGVTGIAFVDWRIYGALKGVFLEVYMRKEEENWATDSYNKILIGKDNSLKGKAFVHLMDNTTSFDLGPDSDYVVRHYLILECTNEIIANKLINRLYKMICNKREYLSGITITSEKKTYSRCKELKITCG